MYALLYRSRQRPGLGAADLNAIIETAQDRNRTLGVTGLLLSGYMETIPGVPGEFVQWLEGPEKKVEGLFTLIEGDPRHVGVEVLARGPVEDIERESYASARPYGDRLFPAWSMGLVRLAELPATAGGFLRFAANWDGAAYARAA